jgi:hypothetical protein
MTRQEVTNRLHEIVQSAVQRGQGNWKLSFAREVHQIFETIGKLSPEPVEKPQLPAYDPKKVRKVGRVRVKATPEQRAAARAILRQLGLI